MADGKETLGRIVKDVVEGDKAQAKAILDSLRGQKITSLSDLGEFEEAELEETLKDAQIKPVKTRVALKSKLKEYIKKDETGKKDDGVISELRAQWAEFRSGFSKPTNDKGTTTNENMFRKSVLLRDQNKCVLTNTTVSVDACHLVPKSESKALLVLGFTCIYDVRLGFALAHQFHSDYDKKHIFAIHPKTLRVILAPNTPKDYPLTKDMVANLKSVTPHLEVSFPTKGVLELAYYSFVQYWAKNGTYFDENGKILSKKRKDEGVWDDYVVDAFSKYKKQKKSGSEKKKRKNRARKKKMRKIRVARKKKRRNTRNKRKVVLTLHMIKLIQ